MQHKASAEGFIPVDGGDILGRVAVALKTVEQLRATLITLLQSTASFCGNMQMLLQFLQFSFNALSRLFQHRFVGDFGPGIPLIVCSQRKSEIAQCGFQAITVVADLMHIGRIFNLFGDAVID